MLSIKRRVVKRVVKKKIWNIFICTKSMNKIPTMNFTHNIQIRSITNTISISLTHTHCLCIENKWILSRKLRNNKIIINQMDIPKKFDENVSDLLLRVSIIIQAYFSRSLFHFRSISLTLYCAASARLFIQYYYARNA